MDWSSNSGPRGHGCELGQRCRMPRTLRERTRPHTVRCRGQCTPRSRSDPQARLRSSLLAEPLGHPSLGLVLVDNAPGFNIAQAAFDLLADVDVVLDVLQRGVVGRSSSSRGRFLSVCMTHSHRQDSALRVSRTRLRSSRFFAPVCHDTPLFGGSSRNGTSGTACPPGRTLENTSGNQRNAASRLDFS